MLAFTGLGRTMDSQLIKEKILHNKKRILAACVAIAVIGSNNQQQIPANSTLIFKVELLKANASAKPRK